MRKSYPTYKNGELQRLMQQLPKSELAILKDYEKYRAITVTSPEKLKDILRNVMQFRDIVNKQFNEITLQDLRDYLTLLNQSGRTEEGKNSVKVDLKNFLKFKFKDWSARFDELRDIKTKSRTKSFNYEKINHNTLVTKKEIERIMKIENKLFWKAFFISLYESGLRPMELRTLQWKDINFNADGEISEFNIFATKTRRARPVYVKEATFYLKRLQEEEKKDSPYVFPSPQDEKKPISKFTVSNWLRELSKKAIGRELFPYILRHSRATELYKNAAIPDKVAQKFMGHSKDMSGFYTHLSKDDVKEAMSKSVYQLEELPPEKKHELELQIEELQNKFAEREKEYLKMFKQLKQEIKTLK